MLDLFFGGNGDTPKALPSEFSPAAEAMVARIAGMLTPPLKSAWEPLAKLDFAPGHCEANAAMLADLMTPVLKAFCTDMGFEAANLGMQCWGGHGYIQDNGVEQYVRDGRINMVYEGANGVQAMDLVGRKLARKGGAAPMALFALLTGWVGEHEKDAAMAPFVAGVKRSTESLQAATMWLAANGMKNPNDAGAGATDYLRMMGITMLALMWGMMAKASLGKAKDESSPLHKNKLMCARYWMERMVPECPMLGERIQAGSATIMAFQ
jgi:hypothetical protein